MRRWNEVLSIDHPAMERGWGWRRQGPSNWTEAGGGLVRVAGSLDRAWLVLPAEELVDRVLARLGQVPLSALGDDELTALLEGVRGEPPPPPRGSPLWPPVALVAARLAALEAQVLVQAPGDRPFVEGYLRRHRVRHAWMVMRTLLQESEHLDLIRPGEYGLYKCLCLHSSEKDKSYVARCARLLVRHLQIHGLLSPGWSSRAGRVRVHNSLLVELWNPGYALLGLQDDDAVLKAAVASLVSDIP